MEIRTVKPSDTDTRKIAVETDTALAATHEELAKLARTQTGAYSTLHRVIGDRRVGFSKWALTDEVAYGVAERMIEEDEDPRGEIQRAIAKVTETEVAIDLANERVDELGRIYNERRWNRYFLVTNNNGHVHRGMGCSTCFADTEYAWLVELTDCDEDAMIDEFGEKACTVCFPDLRTHPKIKAPGRRDREAQAARQAERDERANAKAAKRLAADEVFKTEYMRDRVETVAACKDVIRKAVDTAEELKVIMTPAFAVRWTGDSEQLARYIANVTDNLGRQQRDAQEAALVLLARERRHEGWGATQAQIDKMIASKRKASAKAWATA